MNLTKYGGGAAGDEARWPVQWHADRRKAILQAHPEVRRLYGHDWTTVYWFIGLAIVQVTLTFYATQLSWPVAMLIAYVFAAFPAHTLGLLIHESGHNLVFRRPWANKVFAILANVPLGAPAAVEFRAQHALHQALEVSGFALHNDTPAEARAVIGQMVARAREVDPQFFDRFGEGPQ